MAVAVGVEGAVVRAVEELRRRAGLAELRRTGLAAELRAVGVEGAVVHRADQPE